MHWEFHAEQAWYFSISQALEGVGVAAEEGALAFGIPAPEVPLEPMVTSE